MSQPSGGIPAGLVATFSLAWTGAPLQSGSALGLEPDSGAQAWLDTCHRVALDQAFEASFPLHPAAARSTYRKGQARYLGHRFYEPAPEIGQCRLDAMTLLLDDEDGVPTRLLQLHLKPHAASWHCSDALIGAFAAYARRLTTAGTMLLADDPAFRLWQAALVRRRTGKQREHDGIREHAPGHSSFMLVSLYDMAPDRFEARDQFAYDIHRLLQADAQGALAVQAMHDPDQGRRFGPSPYCEAWFRPGGMVVLSRAYPESYRDDAERLHATALNQPPTSRPTKGATAMPSGKNGPELLPEYPPLRHLAPLVAIHALLRVELLRDSHERLVGLQSAAGRGLLVQLFTLGGRSRELAQLARRIARLDTAAHLKAPAAQALSDALAPSPLREQVGRSLDTLAATGTTAASTALALAAGALALALLAAAATLTGRVLGLF
ncbi:hypothetical protein [Desertibaculum subflavum]|uniref:hypothetical protein n=1 Tax=Desertibaculum subflavum TaxID=2268458 RepID=UPI000E6666D6